ncbi:MAG TPA: hypothetical protein VFL59_09220 [Candidatus Nanopelagicales bacterium]|nr:hypothetical protein [Candidatus Nanopelagicales bacterium]
MGAIGELTRARIRHRPGRWILVALGVALALALPVVSAATGRVVATRALESAVAALPVGERTVIAAYGGARDPELQKRDDALVRDGVGRLTSSPLVHQMLFGELADATGGIYRVAASDALASQVRLTSGRLPTSCTPTRCEVVATGPGQPPAVDPTLGLVVVGTADRVDPLLLPGTFDPGPATRVLMGSDTDTMQQLSSLEQFPRGAGWVAPLDPERVAALGVPAYAALSRSVGDDLSLKIRALVLTVPDDALIAEDARATASRGRFALLGGTTAVLALGFVLVAAAGLRREHVSAAGLLRRRGASSRALLRFALLGAGAAVLVGAVVGAALGWVVALVAAARTPLAPPAVDLANAALVDSLPWLLGLGLVAVVVTTAVLAWPTARESSAWHVVELLAVVCIAVAALVAARGAVGVATVADDPLSIALPVLALIAAALVAARVWVPLASAVSRRLPSSAVAARLAAAGGVRRPLRTAVTAGFVTAAVGSVVFAGAYRATLQAGSADTAAFDVPTTARLTMGPQGADPVTLLESAPLPLPAYAVLRTVAGVRTSATSGDAVSVLGIDPKVLPSFARWDRTVGDSDPVAAQRALTVAAPPEGIPVSGSTLTLPVRSWVRTQPGKVDVTAWVTTADGRERGTALTLTGGTLTGPLPDMGVPAKLTSITMRENIEDLTRRAHKSGEGGTPEADLAGRVVLGLPVGAQGSWSGWSSLTAKTSGSDELAIQYTLSGPVVIVRPGSADRPPVPVLADPITASRGTELRLDLGVGESVAARVVGTLPRFPTLGERFIVTDRASLAAALEDHVPGSSAPHEVWATGSASQLSPALAAAPYDQLVVRTQDARRATLESDVVSQGAAWLLLVAAAVSLVVAILSLVLLVVGERRDDAGQLVAQEADGVATTTLRRSLWWRAVAVAVPGLVLGTAAGLILTRSVSTLIALSATGTAPVPPLIPSVGAGWTTAVLVVGLGGALAVCALVASRTLRSAWPERVDEDLR